MRKRVIALILAALASFLSAFVANSTHVLEKKKEQLSAQVASLTTQVSELTHTVTDLQGRRQDLLAFLKLVSERERIGFVHERVQHALLLADKGAHATMTLVSTYASPTSAM